MNSEAYNSDRELRAEAASSDDARGPETRTNHTRKEPQVTHDETPRSADAAQSGGEVQQAPAGDAGHREGRPLPDDALIVLPTRNLVLFPGVVLPITIGRKKSRRAAQEAARQQRPIGVLLQTRPDID